MRRRIVWIIVGVPLVLIVIGAGDGTVDACGAAR